MPENTAQVVKRLTIRSCEEWRSGKDRNNRDYTIWKVEAEDDAGLPVDADLRSFVELELDVEQEFEVLRYEGPPESFTLKPRKKQDHAMSRAELVAKVGALTTRVERLESQNKWLYEQVSRHMDTPRETPTA